MSRLSAAGCSSGSASTTASLPSPRSAAAIARSLPDDVGRAQQQLGDVRGALRARSRIPSACSKPTIATPSGPSTTWRAFSAPCATRASCSRPTCVQRSSSTASVIARGIGVAHARRPSTGRITSSAALGPGDARHDDGRHAHLGPLGEQRDVRLVLDLAQAGEVHLRAGVLVEHRAADLGR